MIENDWGINPLYDGKKLNFGIAPKELMSMMHFEHSDPSIANEVLNDEVKKVIGDINI